MTIQTNTWNDWKKDNTHVKSTQQNETIRKICKTNWKTPKAHKDISTDINKYKSTSKVNEQNNIRLETIKNNTSRCKQLKQLENTIYKTNAQQQHQTSTFQNNSTTTKTCQQVIKQGRKRKSNNINNKQTAWKPSQKSHKQIKHINRIEDMSEKNHEETQMGQKIKRYDHIHNTCKSYQTHSTQKHNGSNLLKHTNKHHASKRHRKKLRIIARQR